MIALVPAYVRLMGIEAYGLVGFYASLQTIMTIFDLGLSITANRELARLSVMADARTEMRNLIRSLEAIYWAFALFIGIMIVAAAPLLTTRWIHFERMSSGTALRAIILMGISLLLLFPYALYSGGLMGLQRQVLANVILVISATLRGAGALAVLKLISPTVTTYFSWQIVASATQTLLAGGALWLVLPRADGFPKVRGQILKRLYRFAGGVAAIGILGTVLTQLDKIVLSRFLTLRVLGYYTMAGVAASGLYMFVLPIFSAVFPRLSQLVAAGDDEELKSLYHLSSQALSVLVFPAAAVLIFFAPEVLLVWTGNPEVVRNASFVVRLLVSGTALHAALHLPYALQLAHGWTRLSLITNGAAAIALVPFIVISTRLYGAPGAAAAWVILNFCCLTISIHIMHKRLLLTEEWTWYTRDILRPLVGALSVALLARFLIKSGQGRWMMASEIILTSAATLLAAAAAVPDVRKQLSGQLRRLRSLSDIRRNASAGR
jgi:O-antigen/teichoic acid export membrane protein